MFEAGLFVETFLPLFILSAYKNSSPSECEILCQISLPQLIRA